MTEEEMAWDLSQLVKSIDPAFIQKQLKHMVTEAEKFREKYRGNIGDFKVENLLEMFEARDDILLQFDGAV